MRIVIDLQSTQTESRRRGTGRYSRALARAMMSEGADHRFLVVLNQAFPEQVDSTRRDLERFLPADNILLFRTPAEIAGISPTEWRCQTAEVLREYFLSQLQPDFIHVSSVFEGLADEAITSIGRFVDLPTAATLYDLTPYRYPEQILQNPLVKSWYMRKLDDLRRASMLLAISEYSRHEAIEVLALPPDRVVNISADADEQFKIVNMTPDSALRLRARYGITRDFIMYTAAAFNFHKNIPGLVEAYASLPAETRASHQLVIICKLQDGELRLLLEMASRFGLAEKEVLFPGSVSDTDLVALYNLCKLFVFPSLAEGFGLPVLEAMRCGAPVIGSNSTSIPEVIGLQSALFDPTSTDSISDKLYQALTNDGFRASLLDHGRTQSAKFSWTRSAKKVLEALYAAHGQSEHRSQRNNGSSQDVLSPLSSVSKPAHDHAKGISTTTNLLATIRAIPAGKGPSDRDLLELALAITESTVSRGQRQILLDVGELATDDNRTGIPRVSRSILRQLLKQPPAGYSVEPVYRSDGLYRYTRSKMFLESYDTSAKGNTPVDVSPGDVFLALHLDFGFGVDEAASLWLRHHIRRGLRTYFIVHDLLPQLRPDWFSDELCSAFRQRLTSIASTANGLVCISQSVASELLQWLDTHSVTRNLPLPIGSFHLGADIESSLPTIGMSAKDRSLLEQLRHCTGLLMVGILWPRKGHAQMLDAMEKLWNRGFDTMLIIVGRQGWSAESLVKRLRSHPELGKRLIWLNQASDELLLKLYASASCLIVPSEGEGFGIPIVEAARHRLPIIARDLPVFREIVYDNAFYFSGTDGGSLAQAIEEWLELYRQGKHPRSDGIRWVTWEESAEQLKRVIFGNQWLTSWEPPQRTPPKR